MNLTPHSMKHDLAFLHTASVHVETFEKLSAAVRPGLRVRHVVSDELLEDARAHGFTASLAQRVQAAMSAAASSGASVVVCTCSTIGGLAEATSGKFHAMRIDRPMADHAVRQGRRILVVAALESTLGPTRDLLKDSAHAAGVEIQLFDLLVQGAWAHFEREDREAYINAVVDAIRASAGTCDVVVLAQASMSPAADHCADIGIPVLSSPLMGVQAAVQATFA